MTVHSRPPLDVDADHLLVRTVECTEGEVEVELICGPIFDYGREPGEWILDPAAIRPTHPAPVSPSVFEPT